MGNLVLTNNGNPNVTPATYDDSGNILTPEIPADPSVTYIDASGNPIVLQPGQCAGVAYPPTEIITGS